MFFLENNKVTLKTKKNIRKKEGIRTTLSFA